MAERANGGDFVVLTASKTNFYNKYVSNLAPTLDSVATLTVPSRAAANDPQLYEIISKAEAIFITGGDQADYVNYWADTVVETALYQAMNRGAALGGTSAGLAVLGEIDFAARSGTISSAEALLNPQDPRIDLSGSFLSPADQGGASTLLRYLGHTITDSHFVTRDRMGRLMTFMAVMDASNSVGEPVRGIGVNEQTALLIDAEGQAFVVGNPYSKKSSADEQRSVYLLQDPTPGDPLLSQPLTYEVTVLRLTYDPFHPSNINDPNNWLSLDSLWNDSSSYRVSAASGVLSSSVIYG